MKKLNKKLAIVTPIPATVPSMEEITRAAIDAARQVVESHVYRQEPGWFTVQQYVQGTDQTVDAARHKLNNDPGIESKTVRGVDKHGRGSIVTYYRARVKEVADAEPVDRLRRPVLRPRRRSG